MASCRDGEGLHFLLVPLMSQSHLIPFSDVAKQLAAHGAAVTLVLTPLNALRYSSTIEQDQYIRFLVLPFPCAEAGLSDGCENVDSLPSLDLLPNFFHACSLLRGPLESWIEAALPRQRPNCIVSDFCLPWTADLALRFGMPRVVFHEISCFTLLCFYNIETSRTMERVRSDSEPVRVPNVPDAITFTKAQIPEICSRKKRGSSNDGDGDLLDNFKAAELSADGVLVNTFEELEQYYVDGYRRDVVKRLWCVGPVSLYNMESSSMFNRGNKSSIEEGRCLEWLDSRNPGSVIYVCFGSLCRLSVSQLIEIALGLESSGFPFVWVIGKGDCSPELERWFEEEKFEERIEERGVIIRGWAPQVLILSHRAIAGFVMHCGWNSTLEGVAAGVPMITWPMFAEQFCNEKLIVQLLRTGVRVGVEGRADMVNGDGVRRAIEMLMDEGEEGERRRGRARRFGEAAKRAVGEGGLSHRNFTHMIQHLKELLHERLEIKDESKAEKEELPVDVRVVQHEYKSV